MGEETLDMCKSWNFVQCALHVGANGHVQEFWSHAVISEDMTTIRDMVHMALREYLSPWNKIAMH